MNLLIKSDEQKNNENRILRDFGHSSEASGEMREAAEVLARRTEEIKKGEYKR